jgi:hypothetical protein
MSAVRGEIELLQSPADWGRVVLWSALVAFLVIPLHEFGHVIGYALVGVPATMSYAREIVPPGAAGKFLGVAGGPLLTQLVCVAALVLVLRGKYLPATYAVAALTSLDRVVLYPMQGRRLLVLHRFSPGMDETKMAVLSGLPSGFWYVAFTIVFVVVWMLLIRSLRYGALRNWLVCLIPVAMFVPMAAFGVLVVERYLFPMQYHLQFG